MLQKVGTMQSSMREEEGLHREKVDRVIQNYQYIGKPPEGHRLIGLKVQKPPLLERTKVKEKLLERAESFVDTFLEGMD